MLYALYFLLFKRNSLFISIYIKKDFQATKDKQKKDNQWQVNQGLVFLKIYVMIITLL